MTSLLQILLLVLDVAWFIVIAHVIMSWLINFNVLNRNQPLVWQVWMGLNRLLEPVYGPIRRVLPDMGGLDLSPVIVIIALYAIRIVLMNNAYALMLRIWPSRVRARTALSGGSRAPGPGLRKIVANGLPGCVAFLQRPCVVPTSLVGRRRRAKIMGVP